jgi:hypothetical protein
MASRIRIEGVLRTVKEEANPPYGMVLKVTVIGDDGNTYWTKTTARAFYSLRYDDRIVVEGEVKCRKPSTYAAGTEFVVLHRPKLIENKGTDEATVLRRVRVEEDKLYRQNCALREQLACEDNGMADLLDAQIQRTKARLAEVEEARKAATVGESNQEPKMHLECTCDIPGLIQCDMHGPRE